MDDPRRSSADLIDDSRLSFAASKIVGTAIQHVGYLDQREALPPDNPGQNVDDWNDRNNDPPPPPPAEENYAYSDNPNTAVINIMESPDSDFQAEQYQQDTNRSMISPLLVPYSGDPRESVASVSGHSSMQVLLPVHPIPEESEVKITKQMVAEHIIPIESVLPGGFEIHRNHSNSHIQTIKTKPGVGNNLPMPANSASGTSLLENEGDDGAEREYRMTMKSLPYGGAVGVGAVMQENIIGGFPTTGTYQDEREQYQTIINEMAAAVAAEALNLSSFSLVEDITAQLSTLVSSAGIPLFNSQPQSQGQSGRGNNYQAGPQSNMATLPPEVKDYILRTLSEVKAQLDRVKLQLQQQRLLPN